MALLHSRTRFGSTQNLIAAALLLPETANATTSFLNYIVKERLFFPLWEVRFTSAMLNA